MNAPESHGFSDDLAAMVREAARPLIEVGAYLEQQSSALRVTLEPLASGVLKSWLREQGEYMTGVAASIRPAMTAFAEQSRILSSQLQVALPSALEIQGHLLSIPAIGTVFDFTMRVTDEDLAAISVDLAQRGWLLYPLIADAPYSDVVRFTESFGEMGDYEIDCWMTSLTEYALRGLRKGDSGRLTAELGEHLVRLDPRMGEERFRYFRQARRAFILGGLDAMVPPLLLTQGEGVAWTAKGTLTGFGGRRESFYNLGRVKKYVKAVRHHLDSRDFYEAHDDVLLPLSFKRQFEALTTLLTYASAPSSDDEDLGTDRRGRPVLVQLSRHHIGHGGVGFGHRVAAAKAIGLYAGLVALLGQLKLFEVALNPTEA